MRDILRDIIGFFFELFDLFPTLTGIYLTFYSDLLYNIFITKSL